MIDLSTDYLGLGLKNPLVPSSSPLTRDYDTALRLQDAGEAAVPGEVVEARYPAVVIANRCRVDQRGYNRVPWPKTTTRPRTNLSRTACDR